MHTRTLPTIALVLALSALTGCAAEEVEPPTRTVTFNQIENGPDLEYFTVTRAEGVSDQFGDRLTLFFNISNANQTKFSPVATITFTDGSTLTCTEDDLRRIPALLDSTTDWEFPCDGTFPESVKGASILVTDDYN